MASGDGAGLIGGGDTGSQAKQTQVTAAVDESDLNGHRSPSLPCGRVTVALETPKITSSK